MKRIAFLTILVVAAFVIGCTSDRERMQATVDIAVPLTQTALARYFSPTPPPTATPTITPEPGAMIPKTFSVSMPFNWKTYDLSGIGINIAKIRLTEGLQNDPSIGCVVSEERIPEMLLGGLRLAATKNTTDPTQCVALTIFTLAPIADMSLEGFMEIKLEQIEEALGGGAEIKQNTWQLNYVRAGEFIYEQDRYAADGVTALYETHVDYVVVDEGGIYLLSFITPTGDFQANYSEITQIAQSFRAGE
ncbi:MAG: hypothetical protein ACOYYS_09215 [Chloroflexota bacterium]